MGYRLPGGLVSPPGGFASLAFDQAVPKNSQRHLADRNAICILHLSDCSWLCYLLSQFIEKKRTVYIIVRTFLCCVNAIVKKKDIFIFLRPMGSTMNEFENGLHTALKLLDCLTTAWQLPDD